MEALLLPERAKLKENRWAILAVQKARTVQRERAQYLVHSNMIGNRFAEDRYEKEHEEYLIKKARGDAFARKPDPVVYASEDLNDPAWGPHWKTITPENITRMQVLWFTRKTT